MRKLLVALLLLTVATPVEAGDGLLGGLFRKRNSQLQTGPRRLSDRINGRAREQKPLGMVRHGYRGYGGLRWYSYDAYPPPRDSRLSYRRRSHLPDYPNSEYYPDGICPVHGQEHSGRCQMAYDRYGSLYLLLYKPLKEEK